VPDNISESEYLKLCGEFPFFNVVGHGGFGVKVWLIFRALNFGSVSTDSVAANPCQSLMENNITLNQIKSYLAELQENGIFQLRTEDHTYSLQAETSYELHKICYEIGKKITESRTPLHQIIKDCGFQYDAKNKSLIENFNHGDVNAKADTLKDLLSQLAFAGARFLVKVVVKLEEKVE